LPHTPEKSGTDALSWLRSCVNANEDSMAAIKVVALMINVRVMEYLV
jgi:hypothetical protein